MITLEHFPTKIKIVKLPIIAVKQWKKQSGLCKLKISSLTFLPQMVNKFVV